MDSENTGAQREMTAEEWLTALRVKYKALEQELNALKAKVGQSSAGRYVSLALTETESSRHWLGEALGALGVPSPYTK